MEQADALATTGTAETTVASNKQRSLLTVVKPLVSVALIYWILRDTNVTEIATAAGSANIPLLVVAFSLNFIGIFISTRRWRVLLTAQGADASQSFLIRSFLVGTFFNNFLPSTIGGDASRAYDSRNLAQSKASAVAVIFVDRFLGLFALMLFALGALTVSNEMVVRVPYLNFWIAGGAIAMLSIVWLIFMPSRYITAFLSGVRLPFLQQLQSTAIEAFTAFRDRKDVLIRALALSVLLQANVIAHYYLIARALHFSVPMYSFFLIVPLAVLLMTIPISINAIGVRENVFAFFLAVYGISKPEAVAFAWLAYGIVLLQGILGGIIYAFRK